MMISWYHDSDTLHWHHPTASVSGPAAPSITFTSTKRNGFRCDTEVVWVWRPKTSPFEDHEAKTQQVQQTWLPHALEILFKENTIWKDGSTVHMFFLLEKLFKS